MDKYIILSIYKEENKYWHLEVYRRLDQNSFKACLPKGRGTLYSLAYAYLKIEHHNHSSDEKSIIRRTKQHNMKN